MPHEAPLHGCHEIRTGLCFFVSSEGAPSEGSESIPVSLDLDTSHPEAAWRAFPIGVGAGHCGARRKKDCRTIGNMWGDPEGHSEDILQRNMFRFFIYLLAHFHPHDTLTLYANKHCMHIEIGCFVHFFFEAQCQLCLKHPQIQIFKFECV